MTCDLDCSLFVSAEIHFPYLDSQKQETIEYSLWIPAGRYQRFPQRHNKSVIVCLIYLAQTILFVDHGVEVHETLPLYLAGIDVDCLDVLAVPPASSLAIGRILGS